VGGAAVHDQAAGEHALGLDADVKVGRLAGDREVADEPAADEVVARAALDVLGLLVGHAHEADPYLFLVGQVAHRAHHRGERALHVVGAAADQAVALDARDELLRAPRDDVEVAVEDERRAGLRTHRRAERVEVAELVVHDLDLARLEPALDEPGRGSQAIHVGRVVGDQALGERALVH